MSGAIFENVHQTCNEVSTHLSEIKMIADNIGAGFIGLGASPNWTEKQMPMMPKGRYKLMTPYMRTVGEHGTKMMYRTCTVQVNLDYSSELDMIKKMRVGVALQPIATCLFAASPFLTESQMAIKVGAQQFGRIQTKVELDSYLLFLMKALVLKNGLTMHLMSRCILFIEMDNI